MSKYIGTELELFEYAKNWKKYFSGFIKPQLKNSVAEIGAGIGGTTTALYEAKTKSWLCVEPDLDLIKEIEKKILNGVISSSCKLHQGYSSDLDEKFDSLLYIDVIEHIEDDVAELEKASSLLNQGGKLFIIVPAHQYLFSPFDKKIGHYRRYNKDLLTSIMPNDLTIEKLHYLDSVGFFLSLFNKYFLRQSLPTKKQILFWDNVIIPISKILDPIFGFNFGKSLLLIAQKM
jgi:hypothetical protein